MRYLPLILIFLASCSAQKRLNRLIGNHPELANITVDSITLPAQVIFKDSFIYLPAKEVITTVIDSFIEQVPDTNCQKLLRQKFRGAVVEYVAEKECLDTPIVKAGKIEINNDSVEASISYRIEVSQSGSTFYVNMVSDGGSIKFKTKKFVVQPISTAEVWRYRKQGALWLIIALVIIYLGQLAVRLYLKGQIPFLKL